MRISIFKLSFWTILLILLIAFWLMVLGGCSPVKQVLRDPAKTQQVVDKYNAQLPPVESKPPIKTEGKRDTTILTNFDTLYVPGDTINNVVHDTLRLTKKVTVYINKTDTIDRTDPKLIAQLQSFQRQATSEAVAKEQYKKERDEYKASTDKWKIRFYILLGISILIGGITIFLKIKSNSMKQILSVLLIVSIAFSSCKDHIAEAKASEPENVYVSPSYSKAISLAMTSGYGGKLVLGIILLGACVGAGFIIAKDLTKQKWQTAVVGIAGVVCLVGGFALILSQPGAIAASNVKKLDKTYYNYLIERDGNLDHVWDSLKKENRILNAAQ